MKRSTLKIATLMLALTLITSCFVGGTFAKYITTAEGNDTARVAKFGVVLTANSDIFAPGYAKDGTGANTGVSVMADDTKDVVAPGTAGTMTAFTIAGAPEVDVMVTATLDKADVLSMVKLNAANDTYLDWTTAVADDKYDLADDYYPVVWTLKQDGATKASGNLEAIETYLTGTLSKVYEVEANTFDAINGTWTLDWTWAFDGVNDKADTSLGQAAAGVDATALAGAVLNETFGFSITVEQLD